jgi:hypothetical protein
MIKKSFFFVKQSYRRREELNIFSDIFREVFSRRDFLYREVKKADRGLKRGYCPL